MTRDPLGIDDLLHDQRREIEMYHTLVAEIRRLLGDDGLHAQLLDLPSVVAARLAPVAAEPPSLVALVQELQAADRAHRLDEMTSVGELKGRKRRAVEALLAWTPAQAEPAAPEPPRDDILAAGRRVGLMKDAALPASSPAATAPGCLCCRDGCQDGCSCKDMTRSEDLPPVGRP